MLQSRLVEQLLWDFLEQCSTAHTDKSFFPDSLLAQARPKWHLLVETANAAILHLIFSIALS